MGSLSVPGNVMINVLSVNDRPVVASAPANTTNAEDDSRRAWSTSRASLRRGGYNSDHHGQQQQRRLGDYVAQRHELDAQLRSNASGTSVITLTATDSAGASVTTSFTASVNAVNDPPVLNGSINLGSMVERQYADHHHSGSQLLANASDIDSAVLTVTILTGYDLDRAGVIRFATGQAHGRLQPTANFNGNVSFNYTVSDGFAPLPGTAAGVATLTVTAAPDLDTINVNGTLHSSSLNLTGNLLQWPNLQVTCS